jgi:hypothetical protein
MTTLSFGVGQSTIPKISYSGSSNPDLGNAIWSRGETAPTGQSVLLDYPETGRVVNMPKSTPVKKHAKAQKSHGLNSTDDRPTMPFGERFPGTQRR